MADIQQKWLNVESKLKENMQKYSPHSRQPTMGYSSGQMIDSSE